MQGRHGHLSREQKQLALRLYTKGWRLVDIAREVGCSAPMVGLMVRSRRHIDAKPFGWEPRGGCLTIAEREQILTGLAQGWSLTAIARQLGGPSPLSVVRWPAVVVGRSTRPGRRTRMLGIRRGGRSPSSSALAVCCSRSLRGSSRCGRRRRSPLAYGWSIPAIRRCT